MSEPLVTDELWEKIQDLLPPEAPKPLGGRPRVPNRQVLTGILFILRTGIPWGVLPLEMGCGCGMTCKRRMLEWMKAGVFDHLLQRIVEESDKKHRLKKSRLVLDSTLAPAKKGLTNRQESDGPRQVRKQVSSADRRCRGAPMRRPKRCECAGLPRPAAAVAQDAAPARPATCESGALCRRCIQQ